MRTGLRLLTCVLVLVLAVTLTPGTPAGASSQPGPTLQAQLSARPGFVTVEGDRFLLDGRPFVMKGFNYWPRDYGWTSMTDWDWAAVDRELGLAASVGSTTIRTGIDYLYGTGNPFGVQDATAVYALTPAYFAALDRLLELADKHGLKVIFWVLDSMPWDFWQAEHFETIRKHLESFVPRYADDPRVVAWDLYTDLDCSTLQAPGLGGFGVVAGATKANMIRLLRDEADVFRRLDSNHPLGVGFCWPSTSLLAQDFTDFLMPQFLGADHPEVLTHDAIGTAEDYGRWTEVPGNRAAAVGRLVSKIREIQAGLHRPMPLVLSEIGLPSGASWTSPALQASAYDVTLDAAFTKLHLAGAMPWVLTDFIWPPKAPTHIAPGAPMETPEERSFGAWDLQYRPKASVDVTRRYFAAAPTLVTQPRPTEIRLVFARSFVPAQTEPGSKDTRVLVVAVDTLDYLSAGGSRLARLDVGTAGARPYLVDGWSGDEGWGAEAKSVAWVEGKSRTAVVRRVFPAGTASIAMRVSNNLAGQSMTLYADGAKVGTVRIGIGWATYRVSIAATSAAAVRGQKYTLRAGFDIPVSSGTVTFQAGSDATGWRTLGTAHPKEGFASASVVFTAAGKISVRARWSGADPYAATTSRPVSITVRAP